MDNDYKQEIIDFIKEQNLTDVFKETNDFYDNYNCNLYVYIRVSTEHQEFGRQVLEIHEYAKKKNITIFIDNIFCDKYTGKSLNRKEYQNMRKILKENDYILISNLSRLGRDYEAIKKEWYYFKYREIKVLITDKDVNEFISSPLPFEDPNITLNRLYLQDMIFTNTIYKDCLKILEVSNSTKSGLEKAKLQGKRIGKPTSKYGTKENFMETLKLQVNDNFTVREACENTKFPFGTYSSLLKKYRENYQVSDLCDIIKAIESELSYE